MNSRQIRRYIDGSPDLQEHVSSIHGGIKKWLTGPSVQKRRQVPAIEEDSPRLPKRIIW